MGGWRRVRLGAVERRRDEGMATEERGIETVRVKRGTAETEKRGTAGKETVIPGTGMDREVWALLPLVGVLLGDQSTQMLGTEILRGDEEKTKTKKRRKALSLIGWRRMRS